MPAIYRELFDAKKYQYNDQHTFKIGGYDVELYVQNANQDPKSQGIYSVLDNKWISVPKRRKPDVDDISVKSKYEDLGRRIEAAVKSGDAAQLEILGKKVREFRQAGLDKTGEFGPENLAFKILRSNGTLDQLRAARLAAKDQAMSLNEKKKKPKSKKRYGSFGGMFFPGYHYYGQTDAAADGGGDGGGESVKENADSMDTQLQNFVKFCSDRLELEQIPRIRIKRDPEWSRRNNSFGRYIPDADTLIVSVANRHPMDVMRTMAHELTHRKQDEQADMPIGAGDTGSDWENQANAQAGVLMRDFAELHPEYFGKEPISEGSGKSGYKEIEFVCANPEFPEATDPDLQKQMHLGLQQISGVIPLLQDQSEYSEGQCSLTAIYKDPSVRPQILKLAKQLGVQIDLEQPVSDNYVDRAIRGEHYGQRGVGEALVHRGYTQGTDPNDIWNVRDDNSRRLRHRRNEVVLAQAAPKIEQRVKVAYQPTTTDGSGQRYRPEAGSHYAYIQGRMTRGLPQGLETGRPLKFDGRKFMYADSGEIFAGADYVHFTSDRRVIAYNSAKPISVAGPEVSVGVTEDISNEIKTVTRIDSRPIRDFTSNLKAYKHTDDWRQSGVDTGDDSYWKKNNLKTNTTKGLFAGDPHRTALYATGNAHETRYVEFTQNGQPVVYFDKKDLPKIRSRKTYLTVFDAANFKRLPTGEYFSNNPGQPLSQTEISDPFQYITDHGWVIRFTDDLNKVFRKVKAMHKANEIPQYGAEGMAEGVLNEIYKMPPTKNSSQGMADWAYQDAQDKKADSKGSLQGIPSEVYDMGDHLRVFVKDDQGPVLYLALNKFLDGFKSGAVAVEPRGRGKNLAVQVYQAVSDTFGLPIYSDTTQTDASRIGIWQKLMTSLPGRVVGYDQRTQADLPLTATDQGPAVRSNQPVYTQRTAKDLSKPVTGQNRSRTRLLKLLPSQQVVAEASGYIPVNKKEAGDPRYSMALTVDIKPGENQRQAAKMGWKTNPAGTPPTAKTNGLVEALTKKLQLVKEGLGFPLVSEQQQELDEVAMSPSALRAFANSEAAAGMKAGFEAELVFTGIGGDEEEGEWEPDYSYDPRAYSLDNIEDFFNSGDFAEGMTRQTKAALEQDWMEWYDEALYDEFDAPVAVREWIQENDWDEEDLIERALDDEYSEDRVKEILAAMERRVRGTGTAADADLVEEYLGAEREVERQLDERVELAIAEQNSDFESALDEFRENWDKDESDWLRDRGWRLMSDIAYNFDVTWPHMTITGGSSEGGFNEEAAQQLADSLSETLGVKTTVSTGYHGATRDTSTWIFEPDGSLDADDDANMPVEIVSPPMPLAKTLEILPKFFEWAEDNGAYANDSTGFHMSVSMPEHEGNMLDYTKLALFLGDEYVLKQFGREANTYAKSAIKKYVKRKARLMPRLLCLPCASI
jgi:hypothetical protein